MKKNVKTRTYKADGEAKNTFALPPRQRIILTTKDMNVSERHIAKAINRRAKAQPLHFPGDEGSNQGRIILGRLG